MHCLIIFCWCALRVTVLFLYKCFVSSIIFRINCWELFHICFRISSKNICTTSKFHYIGHSNTGICYAPMLIHLLLKMVFSVSFERILFWFDCSFSVMRRSVSVSSDCIFLSFFSCFYIFLFGCFNCCCYVGRFNWTTTTSFKKIAFWHFIIGM